MNKLGYKQKGIPMLKSPLNIEGVTGVGGSKTDADRLAKYNADKKIERTQDRENTAARNEAIKGIFKGVFTKGTGVGSGSRNKRKSASGGKLNESNKNSVSTNSVDYISNVLVTNSAISKCIKEMVNEKRKVVFSYTSAMVDMTKGLTCISERAIKSCTKELSLHTTLLINRCIPKKRLQLGVGQYTSIKIIYNLSDHLLTADSFK